MPKRRKDYTPKFKFQLVVETLQHDGSDSEIARAYDVHPVTLSKWKARSSTLYYGRRGSSRSCCQSRRVVSSLQAQTSFDGIVDG